MFAVAVACWNAEQADGPEGHNTARHNLAQILQACSCERLFRHSACSTLSWQRSRTGHPCQDPARLCVKGRKKVRSDSDVHTGKILPRVQWRCGLCPISRPRCDVASCGRLDLSVRGGSENRPSLFFFR